MTFQFLTLAMIEKARNNNGFIDQTESKTKTKYLFDTLILSEDVFVVLDSYIDFVRPMLNPSCNYFLVSLASKQYQSLTTAMKMLVYVAIRKYIHPTRYRQIVETSNGERYSREDQEIISEDQKHSSTVANVYYKKKQSRNVVIQGKACMDKMLGSTRSSHQMKISDVFGDLMTMNNSLQDGCVDLPLLSSPSNSSRPN